MSFDSILGNAAARERLKNLVRLNRVAHAYLFAGPSGIGKRLAAVEFGRLLLCDNDGCGSCPDCLKVDARTHPQTTWIARREEKREIVVEQVRELLRDLSFKSVSLKPRLILVDEAERMNEEAQNAFLKTLEEPPDRCVIVLITASPSLLLPTIVSRCQTVLFTPLAPEEMNRFLKTLKVRLEEAVVLSALSGGHPGIAAALAPDVGELLLRARDLFTRLASGDLNAVIESIGKIRDSEEARERARQDLTLVAHSLREELRRRALKEPPALASPELLKRLEKVDEEEVANRIEIVLDHLRMIDQNANVPLTVEDALLRV